MFTLFSLLVHVGTAYLLPNPAPAPVRLTMQHASYRDCSRQRPTSSYPSATRDNCTKITLTWPTVVGKPGINAHLRRHLFSVSEAPAGRNLPADIHVALREIVANESYAEESFAFDVITNRQGLLTLRNRYDYDGAGAHAYGGMMYYNYDVAHDRLLTLADLLVAGYTPRLTQVVRQQFYRQVDGGHMPGAGYDDFTLTNDFLITRQGLRFHYDAGDATAVAYGPFDVLLTWQQLAPLLRPMSPVKTFFKS